VIAIAAGGYDSLALRANGSMIGWGYSGTGLSAPPGRTNIVMIAIGFGFSLALEADGMVRHIGGADIPVGVKNVISIAAGYSQGLALIGDGSPTARATMIPSRTSHGIAVSLPLESGRVCRLECIPSLDSTNWLPLPLAAGNGGIITLIDPSPTDMRRFYRIRRW